MDISCTGHLQMYRSAQSPQIWEHFRKMKARKGILHKLFETCPFSYADGLMDWQMRQVLMIFWWCAGKDNSMSEKYQFQYAKNPHIIVEDANYGLAVRRHIFLVNHLHFGGGIIISRQHIHRWTALTTIRLCRSEILQKTCFVCEVCRQNCGIIPEGKQNCRYLETLHWPF